MDIRDFFDAQIKTIKILVDANDKNYCQRFENVMESTKSALASADRAVAKAEDATNKRFDSVNEFRQTLTDQARTFMPRAEFEVVLKAVNEKIDVLNSTAINRQGLETGKKEGMGTIVIIAGAISTLVGLLIKFI